MNLSLDKIVEIRKISQDPVSLETPIGEEDDSHLGDFLADERTMSPEEYTIDSLFDDIWGLYHEYDGKKTPACDIYEYYDNIEVTYDKSNHIPTKIYAKAQVGNTHFFNNGVDGFSDYHVEVQNFQVK